MAKSIKLADNTYLDASGVWLNGTSLDNILLGFKPQARKQKAWEGTTVKYKVSSTYTYANYCFVYKAMYSNAGGIVFFIYNQPSRFKDLGGGISSITVNGDEVTITYTSSQYWEDHLYLFPLNV